MTFIFLLSGLLLTSYLQKQNEVVELRLSLPKVREELAEIHEENIRLSYEVNAFENPDRLMELLRSQDFSHLKYPYLCDVIALQKTGPLLAKKRDVEEKKGLSFKAPHLMGSKPL
ncbi:MAG: hypothetical protein WDZ28_00330 [Simkaniaceae bacterium]